jgi:hypothetical protein
LDVGGTRASFLIIAHRLLQRKPTGGGGGGYLFGPSNLYDILRTLSNGLLVSRAMLKVILLLAGKDAVAKVRMLSYCILALDPDCFLSSMEFCKQSKDAVALRPDAMGSSPGNSLLQKYRLRLRT